MKRILSLSILLALSLLPMSGQVTLNRAGEIWPDEAGQHINAHGGGVLQVGDVYYWYGEARPARGFTTKTGVKVYGSSDLVHWKDLGVALAVSHERGNDIEEGCIMERPKVVFCEKTRQYVMLFHLELKGRDYEAARVGVAVSDKPEGPFTFLRSLRPNKGIWPFGFTTEDQKKAISVKDRCNDKDWWTEGWMKAVDEGCFVARDMETGQMSRDMTVYVDDDGKAYHIYSSEENLTLQIAELTDDYLDYTGKYIRIAPGGHNEAPTIFKHQGTYWLITSGCTGWEPNTARMFSSKSIWGPWSKEPCPFKGEGAENTFGSQGTYVLLVDDEYIFMADLWNPRNLQNSCYGWWKIDLSGGKPVIYNK